MSVFSHMGAPETCSEESKFSNPKSSQGNLLDYTGSLCIEKSVLSLENWEERDRLSTCVRNQPSQGRCLWQSYLCLHVWCLGIRPIHLDQSCVLKEVCSTNHEDHNAAQTLYLLLRVFEKQGLDVGGQHVYEWVGFLMGKVSGDSSMSL